MSDRQLTAHRSTAEIDSCFGLDGVVHVERPKQRFSKIRTVGPAVVSFWLFLQISTAGWAATQPAQYNSDVLQFMDGAFLHGKLLGMDTEEGIYWKYPVANDVIKFRPAGVARIKFEKPRPMAVQTQPTCRILFANRDEVFGDLRFVDSDSAELSTWFGGDLTAPRASLESVTFYAKGYKVVYEGPNGVDGWRLQKGSRGWKYKDGGFVANGVGILGRNLHLSDSSAFAFDLAWSGRFSLSFIIYTDAIDRFDYSINSYMFHLAPGYVSLQRVQVGAGVISIGPQTQIPDMIKKSKSRIKIRINKAEATISLWMDGVLVHRWKDPGGFVAKGSGVVFSSQMDGPTLKISNVHVSEWEGAFDIQESPEEAIKEDLVYLANTDRVSGIVEEISEGKLRIAARQTKLGIPLSRVTQVFFARERPEEVEVSPWEIRVDVAGGGTVAFDLDEWNEGRVSGHSANFGPMAFKPESIRQIQFNNSKTQLMGELTSSNEEIWEFDE